VQREGEVTHLIAHKLWDLTAELQGGSGDARELPPKGLRTRDLYTPGVRIEALKIRGRNFR
jgi:error-prone DNA polymerase